MVHVNALQNIIMVKGHDPLSGPKPVDQHSGKDHKEEGNIDHANTLGFLRGFQHQTQIQVSRNYYGNLKSPLSE